jgi:hypothetical protein
MSRVNLFLRRLLIVPVLVLILFGVKLVMWGADRAPPFKVLHVNPAIAAPGQPVRLVAQVRRDLHRKCSVTFTRHLFDGAGFRHDMEGAQMLSDEALRALDARAPGMLNVTLRVPSHASPGSASLVTALDYECNPMHAAWPIHVVTEMRFTITEGKP